MRFCSCYKSHRTRVLHLRLYTDSNLTNLRRGHLRRVPGGVLRVGAELLRWTFWAEEHRADRGAALHSRWLRGAADGPDRLGRRERLLDGGQYCQLFTRGPDGRLRFVFTHVLGGAVFEVAAAGVGGVLTLV